MYNDKKSLCDILNVGDFMKYKDFYEQEELRERKPEQKNNLIAEEFILKFLEMTYRDREELLYQTGNPIEELLYDFFSLKGTEFEKDFLDLLNSYNFNYSMSIHNAIYYLLATDREYDNTIDPLLWPGINDIKKDESKYILSTILGTIEVYKASEILSDSKSYHIFEKDLMGKCYDRTYDFLRENNDYRAILSYMPNFFYGGHYHAYLEKDNEVLDIASNALYCSRQSINKILCGEILAKLTYKQVKQKFNRIKNTIPDIGSKNKLLTLALYYDRKKK